MSEDIWKMFLKSERERERETIGEEVGERKTIGKVVRERKTIGKVVRERKDYWLSSQKKIGRVIKREEQQIEEIERQRDKIKKLQWIPVFKNLVC